MAGEAGPRSSRRRRRLGIGLLSLFGVALLIAAVVYRPRIAETSVDDGVVGLRVIVLSNDDGTRRAAIEPHEIEASVALANEVYAPAGISFTFDPERDMEEMASTLLNGMAGPHQDDWDAIRAAGNAVAREDPHRITVFYRHGPRAKPASHSFAGMAYDFLGMPGYQIQIRCGQPSPSALAHEIGHYFGLWHTFPSPRPKTVEEVLERVRAHPNKGAAFDGDGLSDTGFDPALPGQICDPPEYFEIGAQRYRLPVDNLMSYYYLSRRDLSPQQIEVVEWGYAYRRAHGGRILPDALPEAPIEAEALTVLPDGCEHVVETVGTHPERWSGGQQLLLKGGPDCSVELELEVDESGTYDIELWASRMGHYGKLRVFIDEQPLGDEIDLFAPFMIPTGPIALGSLELEAGTHRVRLWVPERNPLSISNVAGIDAFVVHRRGVADRLIDLVSG